MNMQQLSGQQNLIRNAAGWRDSQSFAAAPSRHFCDLPSLASRSINMQQPQSMSRATACSASSTSICMATAVSSSQRLGDIELSPILNTAGLVQPEVPEGTEATVFAIFDDTKKLQYVGFSKDCRNSLRTMFTRRPQKTFYYKAVHLPKLDQKEMLDIRSRWFDEVGGQPNGNRLAIERNYWQLPISCGAISDRGKQQAAENEVIMLRGLYASRGCKEDLVPDPALLADGKVDFLPAKAVTPEEMARQQALAADRVNSIRNVVTVIDGVQSNFEIIIDATFQTKGGYIFDVRVTFEQRETNHRIIMGREYYEDFGLQPQQALDRAFAFLLSKKVPRQTEGLMMSGEFPINYFSMSTIEQYFGDFSEAFSDTGKFLRADDKFWRFNRLHDYGSDADQSVKQLKTAAGAQS